MPPRSVLPPACSPLLQYHSLCPSSHLPPPAPPFPPAFICTGRANFETFFHLSCWPLPWGSSDVEAARTLRQVQFNTTNIYPTPPPCQAPSQAWGHRRDDSTKGRAGEGCPVCRDRRGKGGPVRSRGDRDRDRSSEATCATEGLAYIPAP